MTDPLVDAPIPPTEPGKTTGLFAATASMVGFKVLSAAAIAVVAVGVARQLEPRGRGVFVLLTTIASFALLATSLGVNVSARLYLVAPSDAVRSSDYLGLSAALVVVQVVLCGLLSVTLLPTVDIRLSSGEILLFCVLGAALLAQYLLNDALNAFGLTTLATKVESAGSLLQLTAVGALVLSGEQSVFPFIGAVAGANLLQSAIAVAALDRAGIPTRPTIDWPSWRRLLRGGLPGIPTVLGQVLTFRVDRYFVGLFLNPAAVGIYSVAATVPEMLRLPSLALSQPMLYRIAAGIARPEDFKRIRQLCILSTIAASALLFALAPRAISVVFGSDYIDAVVPLRLLLLGEAGIAVFYLDGSALAGSNRLTAAAYAATSGLVLVATLDLLLIPRFGLAGAAWASVVGYSFMGMVAAVLLRRGLRE